MHRRRVREEESLEGVTVLGDNSRAVVASHSTTTVGHLHGFPPWCAGTLFHLNDFICAWDLLMSCFLPCRAVASCSGGTLLLSRLWTALVLGP